MSECLGYTCKELKQFLAIASLPKYGKKMDMCVRILNYKPLPPTPQMEETDCMRLKRTEIEQKLRSRKLSTYGKNKTILCKKLISSTKT